MNTIVFNHDGSIKNLSLTDIIVQGDNNVDEILVAIEGYANESYTAVATFTLPDQNVTTLSGQTYSFSVDGSEYDGYKFILTSAETAFAGIVKMSINLSGGILQRAYTVNVNLTINESGFLPDYTNITMAQYENMIATISTLQPKFSVHNARFYRTVDDAQDDLENLARYQMVLIADYAHPENGVQIYYKNGADQLAFLSDTGTGICMMNISYADLVDLRDTESLIPGMQYRITDYEFSSADPDVSSAGNRFDIIVTADTNATLNENARACAHYVGGYFTFTDFSAWKLKYCTYNDATRFHWADTEEGKGVIYYMKDEWGNEAGYDFKNALITISTSVQGASVSLSNVYTFNYDNNGEVEAIVVDASSSDYHIFYRDPANDQSSPTRLAYSNSLKTVYVTPYEEPLPGTVVRNSAGTQIGFVQQRIAADSNADYSMSGYGAKNNSIGVYESDYWYAEKPQLDFPFVVFSNDSTHVKCAFNKVGVIPNSIVFEGNTYNVEIGRDTTNCYLYQAHDVSIGYECSHIRIENSNAIEIGNKCSSIAIGYYSFDITIGSNCSYIRFGSADNALLTFVQGIVIGENCHYLNIANSETASGSNYLKNVKIESNSSGASTSNRLTITIYRNYPVLVHFASFGTSSFKSWVEGHSTYVSNTPINGTEITDTLFLFLLKNYPEAVRFQDTANNCRYYFSGSVGNTPYYESPVYGSSSSPSIDRLTFDTSTNEVTAENGISL